MKILIINKFLHPNGGSETYIFKLGKQLILQGQEVQYFGMEHENRCVGNRINEYTSNMDFHYGGLISKAFYPIRVIYSAEARRKIRLVLDDFKPDICHLNNFNFQLTPSIILEIQKWKRESRHQCKVVYTAHDYQLICPNHKMINGNKHKNCEKCLDGNFINCIRGKCIHGSAARSVIGAMEAYFWKVRGTYKNIDTIICCSKFMKNKMDRNPIFATKTVVMQNFVDEIKYKDDIKGNYVLYFGRFSEEKGIRSLISVCRELSDIQFVFAGSGPLEEEICTVKNIKNVGFLSGEELRSLIAGAKFSIYPSEWYENCPFSILESQMLGTPVIGSDIGGIPELIHKGKTGDLFTPGNTKEMEEMIRFYWNNSEAIKMMHEYCVGLKRNGIAGYVNELMKLYIGG